MPLSSNGLFVTKTGKVISTPILPPEALPSIEPENKRQFDSVTVGEEFMDEDLRAALFDPFYDNGELQDNFVALASAPEDGKPEGSGVGDFNYEEHIAQLMSSARGYPRARNDISSEYLEEDEESCGTSDVGKPSGAKVEREFEKALLEYDSDECGSLEDPDEDPSIRVILTPS
jgi:protein LTV1